MEWTCDPHGRPRLPGIHDATLRNLDLDPAANRLAFCLNGAAGERLRFTFEAVDTLNIRQLGEAMIVDTIFVWRVSQVPPSFDADASAGWRHLLQGRVPEGEAQVRERARLRAKLPNGILATVVGSYGGELSVLAGSLQIDEWN
ncbi:hypothetical protein [Aureimonas sp. ME7]|uniref:hypothetical protein n=1 Tax=Aureimonas sp. ME7 TaxID=2744252 RepID=UPI0015F62518|nr:hypothetical protein [Aureimonas sp. ME7]